jgi:hypothetical protein
MAPESRILVSRKVRKYYCAKLGTCGLAYGFYWRATVEIDVMPRHLTDLTIVRQRADLI